MHTLFVYGTLMRGELSHHLLRGAERVGPATTAPRFTLHVVDWYPGMADGGTTAVRGELYRVPPALMAALDAYEGPDYARIEIPLSDGFAEAYVMSASMASSLPVIPSGDWRDR